MAEMTVYTVSNNSLDLGIGSSNTSTTVTCKLCLMDCSVATMYTLWNCHCRFCAECMQQYLSVMITEGNVMSLTCPDGKCKVSRQMDPQEVQCLVDEPTFKRYKRIKFIREVAIDPGRTFCPEAACENVCDVTDHENGSSPVPVSCTKCGFEFCSVCKAQWHPEESCDEAIKKSGRKEDEGIPFSSSEDSEIKRCPICHVPIERNHGCAQMMCKQCQHVFCWYCLASLDDDFMLRHYDSGPCKHKLGHSRASVVWHRTQVVGIFAGLGILLLVASPFLLLAAPCILCCKCKICNCLQLDEDNEIDGLTSL